MNILNLAESAYSVGGKSATADVDVGIKTQQRDLHASTAVILAKRTALLDIFRTGTYALCQYRLNNFIKNSDLKELFEKLITDVTAGMKQDHLPDAITAHELKELFEKVVIGVVSSKQEATNTKK